MTAINAEEGAFAAMAQYERAPISQRTKAALQAKKAAGAKLGNPSYNTKRGKKAFLRITKAGRQRATLQRNAVLQFVDRRIKKRMTKRVS